MPSIKHYTEYQDILSYLKENPVWVSSFANGEGSFTASLFLDKDAMWGIVPQCEFNFTQSMIDVTLLNALNGFFNNTGGVYPRQNNVGTVSFRKISVLKDTILPFFIQYPLIGRKSFEFERWVNLVYLVHSKKHVGTSLESRDAFLSFAFIMKDLNSSRFNPIKDSRLDIIISWLNSLNNIPTMNQKLELIDNLKKSTKKIKDDKIT
jgi:hypothetical protein